MAQQNPRRYSQADSSRTPRDYREDKLHPGSYQQQPSQPSRDSQEPDRRSRASSATRPGPQEPISYQQPQTQQRHLENVVHGAFDQADTGHQLSPDLVNLVTQQVLKSLQDSGLVSNPAASPGKPKQPPQGADSPPSSPPNTGIYTPPSLGTSEVSKPSTSAKPTAREPQQMDIVEDSGGFIPVLPSREHAKPPSPPAALRQGETPQRPKPVRAISLDVPPLEKKWGKLFDENGKPLPRLSEFLRGLANHIVDDWEPQSSLVIPPSKMLRLYTECSVPDEIYPWETIFDGSITNSSLSHLYRDLDCQHHYIQTLVSERPSVPALTPHGFAAWMTIIIRAHPELEFKRFANAVLNMPISSANDRTDRFPKELPRKLFPKQSNQDVESDLKHAMRGDDIIGNKIKRTSVGQHPLSNVESSRGGGQGSVQSMSPPSNTVKPTGFPTRAQRPDPPSGPPPEFFTAAEEPFPTASDDPRLEGAPLRPTKSQIERERQPYSGGPGGSRVYEDETRAKSEVASRRSNTITNGVRPTMVDEESAAPTVSRSRSVRTNATLDGAQQESRMGGRSSSAHANQNGGPAPPRSHTGIPPSTFPLPPSSQYLDEQEDEYRDERRYSRTNEERQRRYAPIEDPPRSSYQPQYQNSGPMPSGGRENGGYDESGPHFPTQPRGSLSGHGNTGQYSRNYYPPPPPTARYS